jgi:hypothetical protein
MQVTLHQNIHTAVECGREQQTLTVLGHLVEDALDDRLKAEISHVIGFVDNGDGNTIKFAMTLLH